MSDPADLVRLLKLEQKVARLELAVSEVAALLPDGSLKSRLLGEIPGVRIPSTNELLRGTRR